jgi:hypothetical protein
MLVDGTHSVYKAITKFPIFATLLLLGCYRFNTVFLQCFVILWKKLKFETERGDLK